MITNSPPPIQENIYTQQPNEPQKIMTSLWRLWFTDVALKISGYFTSPLSAPSFAVTALNSAPANAADTGTLGEIRITSTYIYVCVATNTWKRVAIATW